MKPKDLKEWVADAIETENPPGVGYYGAELDEAQLEADRQRMKHATQTDEQANCDSEIVTTPVSRSERREEPDQPKPTGS